MLYIHTIRIALKYFGNSFAELPSGSAHISVKELCSRLTLYLYFVNYCQFIYKFHSLLVISVLNNNVTKKKITNNKNHTNFASSDNCIQETPVMALKNKTKK